MNADPLRHGTPATAHELVILRHGETEWNVARRWQGALDSPLTARGVRQAHALGAMFRRMGVGPGTHRLLTSPQPRAWRTAELAFGSGAEPDPRLREIEVGGWTGWFLEEIMSHPRYPREPNLLNVYDAAPDGEGFDQLARRCAAVLRALDGPAIFVTHGITGRMLRLLALGLPIGELPEMPGGQGVAFRIRAGCEEVLTPGDADWAPAA